jgi:hypothetical protein
VPILAAPAHVGQRREEHALFEGAAAHERAGAEPTDLVQPRQPKARQELPCPPLFLHFVEQLVARPRKERVRVGKPHVPQLGLLRAPARPEHLGDDLDVGREQDREGERVEDEIGVDE